MFLIKKAKQGKAFLIADDHGITDNSSALSFGLIPWSDIRRIYIGSVMNQRFIEVEIPDEDSYIGRLAPWEQKAIQANRGMGHEIVCITLNATGISPETILAELLRLFEQASGCSCIRFSLTGKARLRGRGYSTAVFSIITEY